MDELEPIVAHGARMSWAGILRPGDEFPPAVKSQLAVMTAESGPPLTRCFGGWSERYRRFTSNLSSPRIKVVALEPGEEPAGGIACMLHWVKRTDVVRSNKGSVRQGDGWPAPLWDAFLSEMGRNSGRNVAEKLQSFASSSSMDGDDEVSLWRQAVKGDKQGRGRVEGWLPVPASLEARGYSASACIVSWSPGGESYETLTRALASPEAKSRGPDAKSQATYYAECILARLHGVTFDNPGDHLEDRGYELRPLVQETLASLIRSERRRIADEEFGLLSAFGSN